MSNLFFIIIIIINNSVGSGFSVKYFVTRIRTELFGFFTCQSMTDRRVDSEPPMDLRFGRVRAGESVEAGHWTPLLRLD